jgi:hypothetical protein
MIVKIQKQGRVIQVVRANKPRNGKGPTLAEFSDKDGKGFDRATQYAWDNGHTVRD